MAVATAKNIGAKVVTISEPNRNLIRGRKDWTYDKALDTAVKVLDNNLIIKKQGYGPGFTYVTLAEYTIYSCYSSGNDSIDSLEETLDQIGTLIKTDKQRAIITGDFNAKSPEWGMNYTDRRGHVVTEWIATNDLVIVNQGLRPTFQRQDYGSILDLTIVTENVRSNIMEWEVSEKETLSDHNYIIFNVEESFGQVNRHPTKTKGWQVKKLDRERLREALNEINTDDLTTSAKGFTGVLTKVCNAAMPKRKSIPNKQPAYWWNTTVAELRRECVEARRRYSRSRSRGFSQANLLLEEYKQSKKS